MKEVEEYEKTVGPTSTPESRVKLDEILLSERTHELKTLPKYFEAVLEGKKRFELRKNDRGFQVGDYLWLREWTPGDGYSGVEEVYQVTYMLKGGNYGLDKDYCILSIKEAL